MQTNTNKAAPVILVRESADQKRYAWRQYLVISDEQVAIVEMAPAMLGWNLGRVSVQGSNDWPRMSRDEIVAWKARHDDRACVAELEASFRARLLAHVGA